MTPFLRKIASWVFSLLLFLQGGQMLHVNSEKTVNDAFLPGAVWTDTEGNPIQAHGGQVQRMTVPDGSGGVTETYVWVGENKNSGHMGNPVAVYTSDDLYHWTCRGDVLRPVSSVSEIDTNPYFENLYGELDETQKQHVVDCIGTDKVIERPKMLYNEKNGNYVIWFHSDDVTGSNPNYPYDVGMAGLAVSDSPFGPFRFVDRYRLNECPSNQIDCFPFSKGEARDMNLFLDDDGTAYIVYTSENNKTLYISRLNEDFTGLSGTVYGEDYIRLFPGAMREAPVLIRQDDRYYLMSSSTTGWASNQARVWSSDRIFGKWRNDGNPCEGKGRTVTFDTQSTTLFRAPNGQWIYGGDRWNGDVLSDSRYVWLPVTFENGKLTIRWENEWNWETGDHRS